MAARFLLGVSESVVSPGFVLYTSAFYTRQEQVLRTMLWAAMCGTFSILASLLSFGLGHITNTALKPWMYIFLVLGIISFLTGVAWLFLMPETPSKAKFLTHEERIIAVQRVAENMMGVKGYDWKKYQVWHAAKDIKTWLLLAFVLFIQLPNGGLTNFGTLVVASFEFSNFHTLLILLPASVVSAGSMVVWGSFSMKHGDLRTWGMIIPLLPAIAGMAALLGTSGTSANRYGRVVAFWWVNSYAVTVSLPAQKKSRQRNTNDGKLQWPFCLTTVGQNIAGHTKRAATQTMLFQVFAVGNIAGPFFFRTQDAPKYVPAITISLVCFCVALLCAAALRVYMALENRRRDRVFGKLQTTEEKIEGMRLGMHDKTDLENMDFRYVL
jgi:ACS family allantoate permease-like MFS transporter